MVSTSAPHPFRILTISKCIKGLANAVWEINNDFFPTIKGGGGRLRAVLLVCPDIFASLGLQNQNTKSRTTFLDWRVDYLNHRDPKSSRSLIACLLHNKKSLFRMAMPGITISYGMPQMFEKIDRPSSFISFLRWSYYRPRLQPTMLAILQDLQRQGIGQVREVHL